MEIRQIPIPGLHTNRTSGPKVEITGDRDIAIDLILSYLVYKGLDPDANHDSNTEKYGEIVFTKVIEYRFGWAGYTYTDFPEIENSLTVDNIPTLTEVIDSPYIENMLSKNCYRDYPGERMGLNISESEVKHYRITFVGYGSFNVLALGVCVREYEQ